jgi:guanosine-3',5'-bis(diphosphate) 3'-pyrophosphohydrolase
MKEMNDKLVREARLVAIKAHGNQDYDGIFPYEKHLEDVIDVLKRFHVTDPKYLCAAYLHDVLEDGAVSYTKIKRYFGEDVAEMVYCVTDEMGRNRKEKKKKTLPKTGENPDAVIIKLADRIANIEMGGKIDMYAKEYDEFRSHLYQADKIAKPLWDHLDKIFEDAIYNTL